MSREEFDYYFNSAPVSEQLCIREAEKIIRDGMTGLSIDDIDRETYIPGELINLQER